MAGIFESSMFADEAYAFGSDWTDRENDVEASPETGNGRSFGTTVGAPVTPRPPTKGSFVTTYEPEESSATSQLINPVGPFQSCGCRVEISNQICASCGTCENGGFVFDCTNIIPYMKIEAGNCVNIDTISSLQGTSKIIKASTPDFLAALDPSRT